MCSTTSNGLLHLRPQVSALHTKGFQRKDMKDAGVRDSAFKNLTQKEKSDTVTPCPELPLEQPSLNGGNLPLVIWRIDSYRIGPHLFQSCSRHSEIRVLFTFPASFLTTILKYNQFLEQAVLCHLQGFCSFCSYLEQSLHITSTDTHLSLFWPILIYPSNLG